MADKQQHNGASYGPPILPQQHYPCHRTCECCICLFKIAASVVVIFVLALIIFWLIFRPHQVKYYVTDATLKEFNFTNNNALHYNLNVTITVRNTNKKMGIYYDSIEARAIYKDQRLGSDFLSPFYQGHKNTTLLYPVFKGQNLVMLRGTQLTQFDQEKASGVYSIVVNLYLKIRLKFGKFKVGKWTSKYKCGFKVPLNGTVAGGINSMCYKDY